MIRSEFSISEMKKILFNYNKENILVSKHYLEYLNDGRRDIPEWEILKFLLEREFYFVEKQINSYKRYKLIYELSKKYDLILIIEEEDGKILKVVSAYKTNKKLKEKWKKISKSLMMK